MSERLLKVELLALDGSVADRWEGWWAELEAAGHSDLFRSLDWQRAMVRAGLARCPHLLRVVDEQGKAQALGLLDRGRLGGLALLGRGAAPRRTLLVREEMEEEVWETVAGWLRTRPRGWSTFEAEGVDGAQLAALKAAGCAVRYREVPFGSVALPDSWEAFLTRLSPHHRHRVRNLLRRAEQAGLALERWSVDRLDEALALLVELDRRRAARKGRRLVSGAALETVRALRGAAAVELCLRVGRIGARPAIVAVELRHRRTAYLYAHAWDPEFAAISPPAAVLAQTVRDSIAQRLEALDLGPGRSDFKERLEPRWTPAAAVIVLNRALYWRIARALAAPLRAGARASRES